MNIVAVQRGESGQIFVVLVILNSGFREDHKMFQGERMGRRARRLLASES
jgi:hypothetical protein